MCNSVVLFRTIRRLAGPVAMRGGSGWGDAFKRELWPKSGSNKVPFQIEKVFVFVACVRAQVPRAALDEVPSPAVSNKVVRLFVVYGAGVWALVA